MANVSKDTLIIGINQTISDLAVFQKEYDRQITTILLQLHEISKDVVHYNDIVNVNNLIKQMEMLSTDLNMKYAKHVKQLERRLELLRKTNLTQNDVYYNKLITFRNNLSKGILDRDFFSAILNFKNIVSNVGKSIRDHEALGVIRIKRRIQVDEDVEYPSTAAATISPPRCRIPTITAQELEETNLNIAILKHTIDNLLQEILKFSDNAMERPVSDVDTQSLASDNLQDESVEPERPQSPDEVTFVQPDYDWEYSDDVSSRIHDISDNLRDFSSRDDVAMREINEDANKQYQSDLKAIKQSVAIIEENIQAQALNAATVTNFQALIDKMDRIENAIAVQNVEEDGRNAALLESIGLFMRNEFLRQIKPIMREYIEDLQAIQSQKDMDVSVMKEELMTKMNELIEAKLITEESIISLLSGPLSRLENAGVDEIKKIVSLITKEFHDYVTQLNEGASTLFDKNKAVLNANIRTMKNVTKQLRRERESFERLEYETKNALSDLHTIVSKNVKTEIKKFKNDATDHLEQITNRTLKNNLEKYMVELVDVTARRFDELTALQHQQSESMMHEQRQLAENTMQEQRQLAANTMHEQRQQSESILREQRQQSESILREQRQQSESILREQSQQSEIAMRQQKRQLKNMIQQQKQQSESIMQQQKQQSESIIQQQKQQSESTVQTAIVDIKKEMEESEQVLQNTLANFKIEIDQIIQNFHKEYAEYTQRTTQQESDFKLFAESTVPTIIDEKVNSIKELYDAFVEKQKDNSVEFYTKYDTMYRELRRKHEQFISILKTKQRTLDQLKVEIEEERKILQKLLLQDQNIKYTINYEFKKILNTLLGNTKKALEGEYVQMPTLDDLKSSLTHYQRTYHLTLAEHNRISDQVGFVDHIYTTLQNIDPKQKDTFASEITNVKEMITDKLQELDVEEIGPAATAAAKSALETGRKRRKGLIAGEE
nr:hypothetical protein MmNV_60 [Menippe mercenaria nudivirus]